MHINIHTAWVLETVQTLTTERREGFIPTSPKTTPASNEPARQASREKQFPTEIFRVFRRTKPNRSQEIIPRYIICTSPITGRIHSHFGEISKLEHREQSDYSTKRFPGRHCEAQGQVLPFTFLSHQRRSPAAAVTHAYVTVDSSDRPMTIRTISTM